MIIGIVSMAIVLVCAQFMRNPVRQTENLTHNISLTKVGGSGEETSDFSLRETVHTRWFWMVGVIYFSWVFGFSVVMVHSVIHAIGQGASPAKAAGVLSLIGITTIIGRLIFGRMADVMGMKPAMIVSFSLMALAFLLLLMGGDIWVIYLFAATYGISYGTPSVLQAPILAHMFGLTSLGAIIGAVLTVGSAGFMIGPVLSGHIFDVSSSYHGAFLICMILTLVCLILVAFLPLSRPIGARMAL
jgi:MFS family permease